MPNPVHLLVTPQVTPRQWLGSLKGFTGHAAKSINQPQRRVLAGDHLVRDGKLSDWIRRYIEWNPVEAGLAGTPEEFAWVERDAARKGGRSPKGLTPHLMYKCQI